MKQLSPLVSVVIPVFNGEAFIFKAISSVQKQTFNQWEILVVDDGSTDGTLSNLQSYVKHGDVTLLQQNHGGPAKARNRGIEIARGKFIAFLDCDDTWHPQKLEEQLEVLKGKENVGVVHSDYEIVDSRGTVLEKVQARWSNDPMVQAFVGGHVALPSTLLIRRDVLQSIGGFNADLYGSEDSDLTVRLFRATQFECVEKVLVRKLKSIADVRTNVFDECKYLESMQESRKRFLEFLNTYSPMSENQRRALAQEWVNYYLQKGKLAERAGRNDIARTCYREAISRSSNKYRAIARWLGTFIPVK